MAAAAKRGVKVRILIDKSAAVFELDKYYAKAMHEIGIELRYYNTASLLRISSLNFRNHRKLISVDDRLALTGGRNIENDYFDLSEHYNFLDRDILVKGPIAKTMRESFDEFYHHKITKTPTLPNMPPLKVRKRVMRAGRTKYITKDNSKEINKYKQKMENARSLLERDENTTALMERVETISRPILQNKKQHLCPETTFTTDRPGGNFITRIFKNYSNDYRYLRKTLYDKLSTVNSKLLLSSPYILNNSESRNIMNLLLEKNVDITMYTNSLASTDAVYVAANLYRDVFKWARMGMKTYLHNSKFQNETETVSEEIKNSLWGTHSKTLVYESIDESGNTISEVMIGTYNIDNRSNYYNTEMAIFCKGNAELTKEVEESVLSRIDNAYQIHNDKTATNKDGEKVSIYGDDSSKRKLMRIISLPSYLFKFLL